MTDPADWDALWVFGYGSLVWNPGIEVAETRGARLDGYRRSFCMWSIHHRGSEADPGLVLALEPAEGATCAGLALRAADPVTALAALRERELISSAYVEREVTLRAEDGAGDAQPIRALAYVIDTAHPQYAPGLTLDAQAEVIARATGGRGPNHEYLAATAAALHARAIGCPELDRLEARVQQVRRADAARRL
jgi:cation transport protein ChaC